MSLGAWLGKGSYVATQLIAFNFTASEKLKLRPLTLITVQQAIGLPS